MMLHNPAVLWILHWLVSAFAIMLTSWVVPGFKVRDYTSALIAALLVGIVSLFLRPLLLFVTLPINILTLGLFTFVVDACILKLCAAMLSGFKITSWFSAIIGALVLALASMFLHGMIV